MNRAEKIQDDIFQKMSAEKKIGLTSELAMFCIELNRLNGNHRSTKTSVKSRRNSRRL